MGLQELGRPRDGALCHELHPPPSMGTLMGDFYTCNTKGTFQVPSAEWPTYMCRDFCAFTTSSFEL